MDFKLLHGVHFFEGEVGRAEEDTITLLGSHLEEIAFELGPSDACATGLIEDSAQFATAALG